MKQGIGSGGELEVFVRRAEVGDAEQISTLEQASFAIPWSLRSIKYELTENPLARLFVLADSRGRILAYVGYHLIIDEAEITNICVYPNYRGRGYAELLLETLLKDAESQGVVRAILEVRSSNYPAICLYQKFGFETVGLRHNYYPDNREDALIMGLNLGE